MRFDELPSDVLCEVTSHIYGEQITRLWICGSQLLCFKLANSGGVRDWHSQTNNPKFFFWPPLLPLLHQLQTLHITGPEAYAHAPVNMVQISQLPRSLTCLDLDFALGLPAFFTSSPSPPEDALPCLTLLSIGKDNVMGKLILYTVPKWPRNLQTLVLRSSIRFSRLDPGQLPTSLTTFKGRFLDVHYSSAFPTSLTSLSLHLENFCEELIAFLPSGLLHLHLGFLRNFLQDADAWSQLPPGLKSLKVDFADTIVAQCLRYLPPSLESLASTSSYQLSTYEISLLPANLTRISELIPVSLTAKDAAILPRTLTDIGHYVTVDIRALSVLPPYLRMIAIWNDPDVGEYAIEESISSALNALPSFPLTTIDIHGPDELISSLSLLTRLQSISIDLRKTSNSALGILLETLPQLSPTVTQLELSSLPSSTDCEVLHCQELFEDSN